MAVDTVRASRCPLLRKQAGPSLLFEWPGSGQCTRLTGEDIQVMLKIEHLLLATVASLMTGNALPVVPDLNRTGVHLCLNLCS
jgi:hypothetical protein